jgi:hypothetical protein
MERGRWGFPQRERMQAAETFSRLDAQPGASYAAAEAQMKSNGNRVTV